MVNRVVLVGRITRDIDLRKTPSGLSVARFTVACNRIGSRNSDGSNNADFINCVAWRQSADYLSSYANKGSIVAVEGRITTGSYDGADGKKVYTTEVTADRVSLIGGNTRNASVQQDNNFAPANQYQSPSYTPMNEPAPSGFGDFGSIGDGPTIDISSDDLPF